MIPLADIVALSTSDSNHSSRKSAALIVPSLNRAWNSRSPSPRTCRPKARSVRRSRIPGESGSGGTIASSGFTAHASWTMRVAKSS